MQKDTISILIENLRDPRSVKIRQQVEQVADLEVPVLFLGETGTGKDFWAGYLHTLSKRKNFLNLYCGDVAGTLLESEWFGFKKGAFTGADRDFSGRWAAAGAGTLFLNQIDLVDFALQSKLLRIIESRRYFSLGSEKPRNIQARFVFSADADIEEKVGRQEFREDLFFRISGFTVRIPPLRERKEDILPLIRYFARQRRVNVEPGKTFNDMVLNYPWPGNIREVENFVNQAAIMNRKIDLRAANGLIRDSSAFLAIEKKREMTLNELEKKYMKFLIEKYSNKSKVAKILGISRKSLYNRLKKDESD